MWKDSFITHRAFCDALAEENSRIIPVSTINHSTFINNNPTTIITHHFSPPSPSLLFQPNFSAAAADPTSLVHNFPNIISDHGGDIKPRPPPPSSPQLPLWLDPLPSPNNFFSSAHGFSDHSQFLSENHHPFLSEPLTTTSSYAAMAPHMSATALLQKAAQMGPTGTLATPPIFFSSSAATAAAAAYGMDISAAVLSDGRPMMKALMGGAKEEIGGQNLTRDFLGVGNQVVHLMPVGSNQYSDQSRRH